MKALETEIKVQDRTLRQLKRAGMVALYDLGSEGDMLIGYEVAVIRVRRAEEAFGKSYPEREVYPGNEDWGMYGWSYQALDLAGAQKRFDSLLYKWGGNVSNPASKRKNTSDTGYHGRRL